MVSPSPWPIVTSNNLFSLTSSGAFTLHFFKNLYTIFFISLAAVIYSMGVWFRDVIFEATYKGNHTLAVQKGIYIGVILFIVSEAFFFLAIFWAYFHSGIGPDIEIGSQWPPLGIQAINPFELPLLNTIILLSSGITVTQAHHSLIEGDRKKTLNGLVYTVILALIFTLCQGIEYSVSSFTISDGIFGTCFYFGTGFHGLHVIIGTILDRKSVV